MELAQVIDLTTDVDANASRVVRGLMGFAGLKTAAELAEHVDIKLGTLYNRLNKGKPWLASELGEIARFFDVDAGVFYRDASTVLGELARSRCFPGLAIVPPLPVDPEPHQLDLGLDHVDQGVLELVATHPTDRHLAAVPTPIPA